MKWYEHLLERLAMMPGWGYAPNTMGFAEPTALAALALAANNRTRSALRAADQLRELQSTDGCVGICTGESEPGWPTGWALLAWSQLQDLSSNRFQEPIVRAAQWLLSIKGEALEPTEILGHDVTLVGWPWVPGTHSWVEPTAIAVLGLSAVGYSEHPRVHEAKQLLLDRQIPGGGCNYGNTFVLQQKLLPHVQPTGLSLCALAGTPSHSAVAQSVTYLTHLWPKISGISSLAYAAIGLRAHGAAPVDLVTRLEQLYESAQTLGVDSGYALSLTALAGVAGDRWLLGRAKEIEATTS